MGVMQLQDPERLYELQRTRLLDSPPEEAFDSITRLTARLLDVSIAQITLLTAERQYIKSISGSTEPSKFGCNVPISHSFCQYSVETGEPLAIVDAREHPLVWDNPAVAELNAIAYLGIPLTTGSGYVLGSLCVIDHQPRKWTAVDEEILSDLAKSVSSQIDMRISMLDAESRFKALVENSHDVTTILGPDGMVLYQSRSLEQVLGYHQDELVGESVFELIHPDDLGRVKDELRSLAEMPGDSLQIHLRFLHKHGTWRWIESSGRNLANDPEINGMLFNTRDITDRKILEQSLMYQARHDALTGLANRYGLWEQIAQCYDERGEPDRGLTLLILDLNRFKAINDLFGHTEGDQILRKVANRLVDCAADARVIARLGGDEFAVLFADPIPRDATETGKQLVKRMTDPPIMSKESIPVFVSVGVSSAELSQNGPEDLLQTADVALMKAKRSRTESFAVFDDSMRESIVDYVRLETELRGVIERDEISVHFQPIINLNNGRIAGAEALARWHHPQRGIVPPGAFIPAAEESGVIGKIGRTVTRMACNELSKWKHTEEFGYPQCVSVNVSAQELYDPNLVPDIQSILADAGASADSLVLEITESILLEQETHAASRLEQLRDLGVRVAIDDFGTGYSSLSYLGRLPIDLIKMDRSFLNQLDSNTANQHILETVINLAHRLGLKVVAEGVEHEWQLKMLREMHCDLMQGFYFSHPMTAESYVDFQREWLPAIPLAKHADAPGEETRVN
jgi:diguanylate cyclase (GGDEF)-like protein/PAS domain S-box-containing protein